MYCKKNKKQLLELNTFKPRKTTIYLIGYQIVNQTLTSLNGGALEIMLAVLFRRYTSSIKME